MAPGEEKYFARTVNYPELSLNRDIGFYVANSGPPGWYLKVNSVCTGVGTGTVVINDFGFEYIEYIEGQQITKREAGTKPLIIKCTG